MADAVLIRDGPVSVPLDYVVPQGGELAPLTVRAVLDGTSVTAPFYAIVEVIAPSGRSMGKYRSDAIAAGASADVTWFPGAELEEAQSGPTVGVTTEVLFVDTASSSPVSTSTTLASGVAFLVIVEGTFSLWNAALNLGTPEANAQFPGSTVGRVSTQVGVDADTIFAQPSPPTDPFGHSAHFQISLDGGTTFTHLEPEGGPYGTPQTGHLYRYPLTGQGHPAQFKLDDFPSADNYGKLRVTVQLPSGSGTGSGAGSLLPPADTSNNGQVPVVLAGVPTWSNIDGGSP